jgi:hypothetical protein
MTETTNWATNSDFFTPWHEMDYSARKHLRNCRALTLKWSHERDLDACITATDEYLYTQGLELLVTRGGAKDSRPDPEWREFVKKWKVFEGKREDAAEEHDVLSGEFFRRGMEGLSKVLGTDGFFDNNLDEITPS